VKRRTHTLLVWAAATDATFERSVVDGADSLVGKCIHCQRSVVVPLSPTGPLRGTVEHIHPRNHGGGDDLANLAVACPRCNAGKGTRLDHRRASDPTLQRVVAQLAERRRERWREPPRDLPLPPRRTDAREAGSGHSGRRGRHR